MITINNCQMGWEYEYKGLSTDTKPADCAIYVPAESVNTYKTTSNWNARASYIQAIPS